MYRGSLYTCVGVPLYVTVLATRTPLWNIPCACITSPWYDELFFFYPMNSEIRGKEP